MEFRTCKAERFWVWLFYVILKLGNNNISRIDPGSLIELANLKRLWLNDNRLTAVDHGTLKGLHDLEELYIFFLTRYEQLKLAHLENLGRLKLLSLNKNNLNELTADMFIGLNSLQKLYVSNTQITTIECGALANLPRPLELAIDHNDIECDITMCWIQKEVWEGSIKWYSGGTDHWEPKCSKFWRFHCSGKVRNSYLQVQVGNG